MYVYQHYLMIIMYYFGFFFQCGYPNSWMVSNGKFYISLKPNGVQVPKFLDTSISDDLEEHVSRVTAHDADSNMQSPHHQHIQEKQMAVPAR